MARAMRCCPSSRRRSRRRSLRLRAGIREQPHPEERPLIIHGGRVSKVGCSTLLPTLRDGASRLLRVRCFCLGRSVPPAFASQPTLAGSTDRIEYFAGLPERTAMPNRRTMIRTSLGFLAAAPFLATGAKADDATVAETASGKIRGGPPTAITSLVCRDIWQRFVRW